MRLSYPDAPSEIRELAYRALNLELVRLPHPDHDAAAPPHEASAHVPSFHRVYVLPVRAAAAAVDLQRAKHVSWYDILIVSGVAVAVEVAAGSRDAGPSTYVFRGPQIDRQIGILTALAHDPADQAGEVRILRVPPIAPLNIWLHRRRKGADSVIPVVTTSQTLEVGKAYEPGSFLDLIRASVAHLASAKVRPRKAHLAKRARRKPGGKR